MTQTNNRFLDELAKLMTDAAGAAQGMRREFQTMMRAQGEKILRDMDVVQREEFEAVKEMAAKAREENERLSARIAALEAEIASAARQSLSRALRPSFPQAVHVLSPTFAICAAPAALLDHIGRGQTDAWLATPGRLSLVAEVSGQRRCNCGSVAGVQQARHATSKRVSGRTFEGRNGKCRIEPQPRKQPHRSHRANRQRATIGRPSGPATTS